MSRNYGMSHVRTDLGGFEHPPARARADTQRDSNPLPLQPIFHLKDISHPSLNIGSVIRDAILGSIAGVALLASVFIVLFVRA
jgi:hypothetical protein